MTTTTRCPRCLSGYHDPGDCPEIQATILMLETHAVAQPPPEATAIYRAHLRTLALELRDGLLALADAETAWERRWPWLQAAKACEYVVKRLEGAR